MIGSILGGAAQAVGSIGSLIGARKDKKAAENAANISWQRNYEAQKEFAQNSIQWRVQDAKNAGINPYAVVAGQSAGYTPQDTSYQTNYQGAMSQAMNGLSDAMGQLQMASLMQDVEGKKLDNNKKALELYNTAVKANLGNTSATLQQPWFKTFTDPVKEIDAFKMRTNADGSQVFTSQADDVEPWNLQNVRDMYTALFDKQLYDSLKTANRGGSVGLGVFGRTYHPPGSSQAHPVNQRAAAIADKLGTAAGYFTLPWNWAHYGAEQAWKSFKDSKYVRRLKDWWR